MAGAEMKDIKNRIKSVEGIMQITKAMELVASSKLRKAKDMTERSRPFFHKLYQTMCDISISADNMTSVYTKKKKAESVLFIVIAGDRGLAGGYNTNIIKLALQEIAKARQDEKKVKILPVGTKAVEYFKKHKYDIAGEFPGFAQGVTIRHSNVLTEIITDNYNNGEADEVFLIYTNFKSTLTQSPELLKLLPLDSDIMNSNPVAGGSRVDNSNAKSAKRDIIYDPSPVAVFNDIVPKYLTGLVYCAVLDSFASEQGARRTAMEAASDNAGEMIESLSLKYNRARQASITQEITEIISGANAAKG